MDASDWMKGIFFSVLASIIGAASKLAIRKSWLMEQDAEAAAEATFLTEAQAADEEEQTRDIATTTTKTSQHRSYVGPTLEELDRQSSWALQTSRAAEVAEVAAQTPQPPSLAPTIRPSISSDSSSSYHTANISINPNEPFDEEEADNHKVALELPPLDAAAAAASETTNNDTSHTMQRQEHDQTFGNRRRGKSIYTAVQSDVPSDHVSVSSHQSNNAASARLDDGIISSITNDDDDNNNDLEIESTPLPVHARCCSCCYESSSSSCTMPRFLRYCGMFGMTFINPLCCVLAMNYATPSILAPFSGLTLVWVIVLSRPLIGEYPTCAQKFASSLIVVGEVMVAIFGDHSNDEDSTIDTVVASYKEPAFLIYFAGLTLWMLLLGYWIKAPPIRSYGNSPTLKRFAWGASGGSVTGLQNFLKDSLVVIKASPSLNQLPWFVPVFVMMQIAASFGGLLLLTGTMKRYDATFSAAMFVGSFVVSTSIMSACHYHTFSNLADRMDLVMYPLGLVVLMVGVSILVRLGGAQAATTAEVEGDADNSDRLVLTSSGNRHYMSPSQDDGEDGTPVLVDRAEVTGNNGVTGEVKNVLPKSETTCTASTRSATTDSHGAVPELI